MWIKGREPVQTKPSKTLVKPGDKQEGAINSAERAVLSAAAICVSEGGNFIPRIIIFPRRNM
jgi:hypothetical protein